MRNPPRATRAQAVLHLEFEGPAVRGSMTDAQGRTTVFESWLALHGALRGLGPPPPGHLVHPAEAADDSRSHENPV